ncbi:MAG: PSD1 and planctomycete cytochrome C domain-containing protein [Verrucomicrobiota bacterium]
MQIPWWRLVAVPCVMLAAARAADGPIDPVKLAALPPSASASVDFARDIQPLLAEHCYSCHGPERRKSGLRLDEKAGAMEGGDSGVAIQPGQSAESRLIQLVAGLDPDRVMPPKGERLSGAQISLLRGWIDQGAHWPTNQSPTNLARQGGAADSKQHWSFVPVRRTEPPKVAQADWPRNPIDHFILARLESEGIRPSEEADRYTLARRLSLDLTGLPPAPDLVQAFAADRGETAYERLVDSLLASPQYGEQWARHWLDQARYADSDGYEKDFYRPHAWRWRDWVIDSINRDQPFDAFTRDQIAGDLLPDATGEQLVATGFHRNTLLNREGGVDIEEDRCKTVVDRVSTVGATWLGLTVGCAECHSHKYDPISQKEFYSLYAFFNSTDDRDIKAPLPSQGKQVRAAETALEQAKRAFLSREPAGMDAWIARVAALPEVWFSPKVEDYELPTFGANNGANLYPQEDGSFLVTGMIENPTHYIMMLNTRVTNITGIRVEAMTDEMLPQLGPGWAGNGNFVLTEVHVESASLRDVSHLTTNALASVVADYAQPGFPIEATIDGITTNGGWAVDLPHLPIHGLDRCAVYTLRQPLGDPAGLRLKVSLVQNFGKSHTLGRVRVSYTTAAPELLAQQAVPERIRALARMGKGQRTVDEQTTLKRYYEATFQPDAADLLTYCQALRDSPGIKGDIEAQTLAERSVRRATHVHIRGNFLDHGAEVQPGTPAILHPFHPRRADRPPDRLDLANWLTDPANPLTSRVTVNQVWMRLFGEGLVATVADFGNQGDKPTHPELLDWLASEFVRQGWSRKALIKLIVTSATYRQKSDVREDLLTRDAKNRWLARQNRFRLSAENTRDQYLAASGLLERQVGGQSCRPESRRRGVYLQFRRSFPEYMLTTFDAPSSTQTCPKRERSSTPLQALTLMNDRVFVESSQALARRMVAERPGTSTAARIAYGFECCLARPASAEEQKELTRLYERIKGIYYQNPAAGVDVAGSRALRDLSAPEAAAYAVVARTILNLDEVVTRD